MKALNYHHLRYFWAVATEGTMIAASRRLGVAQPTVTAQIQALEDELDEQLFLRRGKRVELTDAGRTVYEHAEEIFRLGDELVQSLDGRARTPLRLSVGASDNVSKMMVRSILEPARHLERAVSIVCREWRTDHLLAELAVHRLDLVITDAPSPPSARAGTISFVMGQSAIGLYGVSRLARKYRRGFPRSLRGAPVLLPADNTALRHQVDRWLFANEVDPVVVAETEDRALMNYLGQSGWGLFPGAGSVDTEIRRMFGVERVGWLRGVREHHYVVTLERKLRHPGVKAITAAAARRYIASAAD